MIIRPPKKISKSRKSRKKGLYKNQDEIESCKKQLGLVPNYGKKKRSAVDLVTSKGEREVADFLVKRGVRFKREKSFKGLVSPSTGIALRFDFWIPSMKTLIEYDGIQHFKPCRLNRFGADLPSLKARDLLKDEYAKFRGFRIIRISYNDYNRIAPILSKELNTDE